MTDCREQQSASDFSSLEDTHLYAPARLAVDQAAFTSTWSPPITRLLVAGYSFLPTRYTEDGFLFRGMETGVSDAIAKGYLGHFNGSREECHVEQIMDVCFLTHEIRDALTVSDPGNHGNGGILVLSAAYFNRAVMERSAAVMAIGDSGMVFRYPFLTGKIALADINALVVTESLAEKIKAIRPAIKAQLLIFNPETDNNENTLLQLLSAHGIVPAEILPGTIKPRRDDLITA